MKKNLNALWWILFVCGIGIAQIGIIWLISLLNQQEAGNLDRFYADGFFLFFSISLIAGIFYEFQFETECNINKPIKNVLRFFCLGLGGCAMLTYAIAYSSKITTTGNISNYVLLQNYIAGLSVIVSLTMKGIIYHNRT